MTAAPHGSSTRRWASVAAAFSLAVSLVVIPASPALAVTDTYRDNFDAGFSGSDGSAAWATDWIETGESDGVGAGGVKVEVEPHCASGPCLTLGRLAIGGGNVSVEREVDLSLASSATLQFDFKRHDHLGVSGQVVLEVSADGGGGWDPLQTWDLSVTDPAPAPATHDISSYRSVDTRIRFRLINDTDQSHFNVDNLVITADNDLSPYKGGVAINEVLFDQTPADDEEFVELLNATASTVSLDGWTMANRTGFVFYTFPVGASLAPGEYAVVWLNTHDPGGLRDAPAASFQDQAGQISNFFWDNGDAVWLHDSGDLRVDFVAWGTGASSPPPEWDDTHETSLDGAATTRGQSISLTPNGIDGNTSACWEPTTSGDASGRYAGALPTRDTDPVAQLWSPGVSNQAPPANQAPVFDQDLLDRSDAEGTLISVSAGATDPDLTDTLTYTATGLPEGISFNTSTGLISGALGPNAAGSHVVTITVTDDGTPNLQDIDTFTWTVTAGEVAYLVANTGGGNGGDDQLTAVDLSDSNPATNEINIGTGTGTTNVEAIALQPGTDILFAVENDQLGTIDLTTGIYAPLPSIVGSGNGAVGLVTLDNIESLTFNPFTAHLYGTHRRNLGEADLLFRLDPTTGAVISGVFGGNDYVPIEIQFPYHHAADLAFDPTDGQLYGIHWDLAGANSIAIIDPDAGTTTTVGPIPQYVAGLAFDAAGRLWATSADTPAPYFLYEFNKSDASVISTTTIDNGANYEAIAISFPFEPNQPPLFDQDLLDRSDAEGTPVSVSAAATDPDLGDILTFTATGLPPGLTINPGNGLITGTITFTAAGTHPVAITTTDNGIPNLNDIDTFTWTITEANQAPAFNQDLLDRSDPEGTLISISAAATDFDAGDGLLYSAVGLPEGVSIDSASGLITGALGPNAAGSHPVTITVTDDGTPNLQDIDTFTWTVTAGEVAYLVANTGGGNGGDDQLTAVDLSDSNPATNEINIGTGTGTTNVEAIALQPGTDILFAVENDQLGTIDLTTGVFTPLPSVVGSGNGPVGLVTFDNIESLTFNPFTAHLYGAYRRGTGNEDLLFRIDPTSGVVVSGAFGGDDYVPIELQATYYHAADLAFNPTDGQLYGIHWDISGPASIAIIDADTGATTTVGAIPNGVAGLAFDDTGGLWGTSADTPAPYFLYEFNKSDASVISTTTIDNGANYEAIAISFPFEPNQPPLFDQDLLDRSDAEGTPVSVSAAATDPDLGDILTFTATGLPPGLTINPGNGLITGTITFTAAGTHPVAITTTDNGIPNLNDIDTFTWTITEANQAPAFNQDLLDRSDPEGTLISISAAATDFDAGDGLLYSAVGLPPGLAIDPGTGLISGTLTFTASGAHPVAITATDDGIPNLNDVDTFTWTVTNTNRTPVIVNPGAQTTPELAPFTLVMTASDPDLTIPSFSDGGTLPAWASFTDNLDGTATITGTPGGGDSATTTVTITADDGFLSGDAVFDLTVTNTNLAPVIVSPGDQLGAENTPFTITVTATDPDTTLPSFTATGLPTWATLTDNADGTATITGTPSFDDAAITSITVTASDGSLTDDTTFNIDITNTNRAPIVAPVTDQTVAEADPFSLLLSATDPDLTIPSFSATGLPAWATFTDNTDGTGTITGTPGYNDANIHLITITATDGTLTDDAIFGLIITNTNRAPIVAPIADQSVAEADPFLLVVSGTDPDGTVPFLNVAGLPAWASFTDNTDGTGTISGTPGHDDAGTTTGITITATDDGPLSATKTFTLTVTNTNRAPVIVSPGDQLGAENTPFTITVTATDPDTTLPSFTATGLPTWATLTDNADGTATITGTPSFDDAAITSITVTASDGSLTDDTTFNIDITNTNRAPIVAPVTDQTVAEADPFSLLLSATDPDLTIPSFSATGLPAWATFTDNTDGTGTITGTPGYNDANIHLITITATDGTLTDDAIFGLIITNTNRAPIVAPIADQSVAEADPFLLVVSGTDPDGTVPFLNVAGLPAWASFTDNTDGTGTISGTPGHDDAGTTTGITITATDDGPLSATKTFTLTVTNTNRAPVIVSPGDQLGAENTPFTITVTATDPDTTLPSFTATGLPTWATLTDNADGTATITGTPSFDDAAITSITVTASDGSLTDDTTFNIDITNTNRAPIVAPVTDQTVAEADPFSLLLSATDPDLTIPSFSATGLPAWATFTDNTDGTGTITGTPGYNDANIHLITITATDGTLTDDAIFGLIITNTNRAPVLVAPADVSTSEATPLSPATLTATDPDGDALAITASGLPPWASLTDNGDGTATVTGTPGYDDAGTNTAVIVATDATDSTAANLTLTVTNTNRAPVAEDDALLVPADAASTVFSVLINDSDPDGDPISMVSSDTTGVGSLTDEGGGTFRYVPGAGAPYAETFTYTIADPAGVLSTATVFVSVSTPAALPPIPPAVVPALIGLAPQSGLELEPVVFTAALTVEADVTFSLIGAPDRATIDPETGTFTWTPAEADGPGEYSFVLRITEDSTGTVLDEATVDLSIVEAATAPTLGPVGLLTAEPGSLFTTFLTATDPDIPAQTPRFELVGPVPAGARIDSRSGELTWAVASDELIGRHEIAVRVRDASDPGLFDELTMVVTIGAASSADRRATLMNELIAPGGSPRQIVATEPDGTIQRTFVVMARAGMGSARALGTPFLLLLLLTVFVLSMGRISLHPLLGRSRRMEGTVAWFDNDTGYGFIIPDGSAGELFLHRSALAGSRTEVTPGDRVSFRIVKGGQRSFALHVKGVER